MATNQEIINSFVNYMKQNGGVSKSWYVGIAADARDRLFNGHGVHQNGDAWIYQSANSAKDARDLEYYFLNTYKTDGGTGGGDWMSKMIYAYYKNAHTKP
jgi:hypothetical protein